GFGPLIEGPQPAGSIAASTATATRPARAIALENFILYLQKEGAPQGGAPAMKPAERWTADGSRSTSIRVGADDLAPGPRTQCEPRRRVDRVLDEMDRAVAERRVDPAGVIAPRRAMPARDVGIVAVGLRVIRRDRMRIIAGAGDVAVPFAAPIE